MFDTPEENQAEVDRFVYPLTMQGGTTFRFITDGIHVAVDQARTAAVERVVRLVDEHGPG
jgi:hypothetical protein